MFQHSCEIFCLRLLIFTWHESLQDLKTIYHSYLQQTVKLRNISTNTGHIKQIHVNMENFLKGQYLLYITSCKLSIS